MTTLEIGTKLVALVRAGKNAEAIEALYSAAIVSVEAAGPPGESRESTGIPACLAKGKAFRERFEVHGVTVEGPFPHDDRFAVMLKYDLTPKTGPRLSMAEVALYTVANGKIVREEFFYSM